MSSRRTAARTPRRRRSISTARRRKSAQRGSTRCSDKKETKFFHNLRQDDGSVHPFFLFKYPYYGPVKVSLKDETYTSDVGQSTRQSKNNISHWDAVYQVGRIDVMEA